MFGINLIKIQTILHYMFLSEVFHNHTQMILYLHIGWNTGYRNFLLPIISISPKNPYWSGHSEKHNFLLDELELAQNFISIE